MIDSQYIHKEEAVTTPISSSSSPKMSSSASKQSCDAASHTKTSSTPSSTSSLSSHKKRTYSKAIYSPSVDGSNYEDTLASTATTPSIKRRVSLAVHSDIDKYPNSALHLISPALLPYKTNGLPPLAPALKSPTNLSLDSAKHPAPNIAPKPLESSSSTNATNPQFQLLNNNRHSSLSPNFGPTGKHFVNSLSGSMSTTNTCLNGDNNLSTNSPSSFQSPTFSRHRPIRSCTHCRQQKIKCNALEVFPAPCTRCARADRKCVIDPLFKPHKGGQVQSLRDDISHLKQQLAAMKRRESVLASALEKTAVTGSPDAVAAAAAAVLNLQQQTQAVRSGSDSPPDNTTLKQLLNSTTAQLANSNPKPPNSNTNSNFSSSIHDSSKSSTGNTNKITSNTTTANNSNTTTTTNNNNNSNNLTSLNNLTDSFKNIVTPSEKIASPNASNYSRETSVSVSDAHPEYYIVGDVQISHERAEELHQQFMTQYLPFLPIIQSNSAAELYQQSQLLFWTVCLTASLSEPTPTLYNSLCSLIKQLAIETCWIQTPRSTHIVQALLILGNWPLPNEKVLDDCSYRFITLSKSLAMQLGLHRGKFIYEFSRTQVSLPDAEKWRTRTWIAIFVMEQVWCANLGLPPNMPMDYLLEQSRTDVSLPKSFRSLACLAMFCSKLVNLMGSSVTSPDGTLEPKNRFSTLGILEQELGRLVDELGADDVFVEIYSLYLKMMICVFSFLPETPIQDQTIYIIKAYHAATRVVTLFSGLAEKRRIIEYPIYIRQPVSLAAFILFRLHLSPLLLPQYVESARQSVVTVHRLFRNMLAAWKDVQNDISRTAKILEKLNFVIITHPELFTKASGIITRMRSHLTASLFYELVWAIHEARRRGGIGSSVTHTAAFVAARAAAFGNNKHNNTNNNSANTNDSNNATYSIDSINSIPGSHVDSVPPLPFYNQITKEDFTTTTTTSPNGTTITTLVPTKNNLISAHNSEGSTVIYGSSGTRIYTNQNYGEYGSNGKGEADGIEGQDMIQRSISGDNAQSTVSGIRGVTKLEGIGHTSKMLNTGGPDVAGSLAVDNNAAGVSNVDKMNSNKQQSFKSVRQFQAPLKLGQMSNYPTNLSGASKNGYDNPSRATDAVSTTITTDVSTPQARPLSELLQPSHEISGPNSDGVQKKNTSNGDNKDNKNSNLHNRSSSISNAVTPFYGTTGSSSDPLHLDTLMQGIDWLDPKGDDLLGWMDSFDLDA